MKVCSNLGQVGDKERELKHKLRPRNAFLQAEGLNLPAACPREELHQFLIGLYGEYVIPSSMHKFIQVLRGKELRSCTWVKAIPKGPW